MKVEKVEPKKTKKRKKINIKSYIRDFLLFVDKNILKTTGILIIVTLLLVAVSLQPMVISAMAEECEGSCRDGVTILSGMSIKLQMLLLTGVAGIVPYIFAPVIGLFVYIMNAVSDFAYGIKAYGYLAGIGMGIVPLILNILSICIITALGMYICRKVTIGYRISNIKNMNFTNFRIKLYEVMQKEEKVKQLTKARDEKIEKLQSKKEKINYLQILNTSILVCIIQFISVIIQEIIL